MNRKLILFSLVLLACAFPSFGQYSTDMLNAHNNVRANGPFGPNPAPNPPLTPFIWNTAAASTAASWAATCQFAHNPNRGFYGENIYASTFNPTPANIVSNWASEAQYYNLSSNTCAAGQVCGHYTQIVWNSTTSIGCATQFCSVNSPFGGGNWYIAVCDYSPPGNYIGQKPYTVVSTPLPGTLQFSSTSYSVNENGVTATISVTRASGSGGAVSVQYSTSNGTATAGQDYTSASGTLSWADGDASTKSFSVPITDDNTFEGNETVNLSLSNPGGGATLGSPSAASLTIVDNESQPTFSINNVSKNEGNSGTTSFTFNITLSGPSAQSASVTYSTANGTATAPSDYTAVPATQVTFNPGDPLTKSVTVFVNGDTTVEQNETFFVNLSGAINAGISVSQGTGTVLNDDSSAVRRAAFDYDGDGKTDPSVFRPSNNTWFLNRSQAGLAQAPFGMAGDVLTPADFTGDGKTDIAVFRPSSGMWYVLRSEDGTFYGSGFGQIGDIPAPADYDGDGKADVALYRPGSGTWYVQRSTAGFMGQQFGIAEDKPAIGDFDGDGKADISVYRPSTGTWYRLNSSNGTFSGVQFGAAGDKIVPADYTGDGKTDVAVFRPSNGTWYVLRSEDGSFYGSAFGVNGDIPAPGDFDGDGKTDLAVYRPSQGNWFMLQSTAGFSALQFGAAEDKPTPGEFVF